MVSVAHAHLLDTGEASVADGGPYEDLAPLVVLILWVFGVYKIFISAINTFRSVKLNERVDLAFVSEFLNLI